MTHEQFSFWLEGYLAAGGTDIAVIRAKLTEIRRPSLHTNHIGIRGPAFATGGVVPAGTRIVGGNDSGTWVGGGADQRDVLHEQRTRTAAQAYAEQEELDTQNMLRTLAHGSEAH